MGENRGKYTLDPKLLAISFYYPPANNPRAVQVARLLRHVDLPISLACAAYEDKSDRRDERLVKESRDFLEEIHSVPFNQSFLRRNASRLAGYFGRPFWEEWPDNSRHWKKAVLRAVSAGFDKGPGAADVLVTFGSPMSDHLIGLQLKQRYGIPWVAHFSDPWVDNPFKAYGWLTRRANLSFERKVIENADRLLFTSAETIDLVMAKYPPAWREKTGLLPHSYETDRYQNSHERTGAEITIRFLGDMYGPRTPKPVFEALAAILTESPELLRDVRLEFVGSMCELNVWEMGLNKLPAGLVVLRDTVPNSESLTLTSAADGLMVIDAPAVMSPFLPSKLIDYIGAARPILGISPPGTTARLISALGGWVGDPSDPLSVRTALAGFISFLRERRASRPEPWGRDSVRKLYEAESVAAGFRSLVQELAAQKNQLAPLPRTSK